MIALRDATPGDVPLCAAILREWIEETPWFPRLHSAEEDHAFLGGMVARGQVRVAGAGEGFLARDAGFVKCLYVRLGARGRGIGAALLADAKAAAPRLELWTFVRNVRAQAFYLREGFREGRRTEGDNEEGLPDIEYLWERADE